MDRDSEKAEQAAPLLGTATHAFSDEHSDSKSSQLLDVETAEHPYSGTKLADKSQSLALEYRVPTTTKLIFLTTWLLLNLILTILNKYTLNMFPFPWLLTCLQCTFVSIGCGGLSITGVFEPTSLSVRDNLLLAAFSSLFTLNIALSNVSLALVSVPFHQILRATGPIITMIIQKALFSRKYPTDTYLSNAVVLVGCGLVTYGEYRFTLLGLITTLLGIVLASIKNIVSNYLMTGSLALAPIEILLRLSPLAAMQAALFALFSGELTRLNAYISDGAATLVWVMLLANGLVAVCLNITSFQTNKLAGPLSLAVAGNFKQCLTIGLGVVLFHVQIGLMNGAGMLIAMGGAAWYSAVEVNAKKRRSAGS